MVTRTYVDSGVLIAAATGRQPSVHERALTVFDDPDRTFVSSAFVRLEVLPKAIYLGHHDEAAFYERFFASIVEWAEPVADIVARASPIAVRSGLAAMDALHVAASAILGADELVTTESPGKPLFRTTIVAVVSIHPGATSRP